MSQQTVDNGGGSNLGKIVRVVGWGGAGLLLLTPLVAMQFTKDVQWAAIDFIAAGGLLAFAGGAIEVGARMSRNILYRVAVAIATLAAFLSLYINMAVGIVGDEANTTNWLIAGVLLVPVIGSVIVRFRPSGMALVMFATAAVQAGVALVALTVLRSQAVMDSLAPLIGLTAVFVAMFTLAGGLFRRAADEEARSADA